MKPLTVFCIASQFIALSWISPACGQVKPRPLPLLRPKPLSQPKPSPSPNLSTGRKLSNEPKGTLNATPAVGNRTSAATPKTKLALTLARTFNRSPGSILKTWAHYHQPTPQHQRPQPPGPEKDSQPQERLKSIAQSVNQFEQDVILSHWDQAKKFISTFEKTSEAKQVYLHLLTRFNTLPATVATPAGSITKPPVGVVLTTPTGTRTDDHVLAPMDVVGIIQLAPQPLTSQELSLLGSLVAKSLRQGFEIGGLVEQFVAGLPSVGGKSAENRLNAAKIFLAAGRPIEGRSFLQPSGQPFNNSDPDSIVVFSEILQRQYKLEKTPQLLEEAWNANQTVLATPGISDTDLQKALKSAVELAPKVSQEIGQNWLEKSFSDDANRGIQVLAGIGQATADGQRLNRLNPAARQEGLNLQRTAVGTLLKTAPNKAAQWSQTLDMLALNWLKEAKFSLTYAKSTGRPQFRRDRYGNIYYATNDEIVNRSRTGARPRPIPVQDILDTRPQTNWFDLVNKELKPAFEETLARLYLKNAEEAEAFPYIEAVASHDAVRGKSLVDEFLQVWTRNHNPNENRGNRNQYVYFFGFEQRANSIPLTRSKQQRNLKELQGWIAKIKKLGLEEIDEQALVRAFTTCHSTAEVYRIKDIEDVFGSIQALKPNTIAGLVQKMRTNLSTSWRQPRVQESKKTNRKEPQIRSEVLRGYKVATQITQEALFQHQDSWELQLAKACIHFDQNAYQQEIKKSSEFTEKQNLVFDEFATAAKTYARHVQTLEENEHSTEVFDIWFYAALGSCDLSLLSHEKVSAEKQFDRIRGCINGLPGESSGSHFSQFANKLFTRMSPLKPEMKYRYLKGGFAIVGDHPDAAEAQNVFQYY
ncbi:MAG: hypothetical protein VX438_11255, partial [Planctomycetota bacterium]|nr:hypothetical protein [Planctomycetota bacterium]